MRRIASAMGVGSSAWPSSVARYLVGNDEMLVRTTGRGGNGSVVVVGGVGRVAERSLLFSSRN